eukprot:COSAG03_NODE_13246_length_510_cov_1.172749_1_plen_74_part_01
MVKATYMRVVLQGACATRQPPLIAAHAAARAQSRHRPALSSAPAHGSLFGVNFGRQRVDDARPEPWRAGAVQVC